MREARFPNESELDPFLPTGGSSICDKRHLSFEPVGLHLLAGEVAGSAPATVSGTASISVSMCVVRCAAQEAGGEGNLGFGGGIGEIPKARHQTMLDPVLVQLERPKQHVGVADGEQ